MLSAERMIGKPLRILQVSTADIGGGAEKIALELAKGLRSCGHRAWLAVGKKRSSDALTFEMADHRDGIWARGLSSLDEALRPFADRNVKIAKRARKNLREISSPLRPVDLWRGREDFRYPETRRILEMTPEPPDVLHCHNLHGGYFDLRRLPWLSDQVPVVLTLHDEWTLTGHCAYTLGCARWQQGCGACPDLSIYPAIRRDATAVNSRIKQRIYESSTLYVTAPSRWLLDRAERSMLAKGMRRSRVIHNGIDPGVFRPGDRIEARAALGLPQDRWILLSAANQLRRSRFKDFAAIHGALLELSSPRQDKDILFIGLGDDGPPEMHEGLEIRFVPFEKAPAVVADYYRAADLFVHAAKSENFPNTILESLACGTPVIATAVGGIPEQIRCLDSCNGTHDATGLLVPPSDCAAIAAGVRRLLSDGDLRRQLSKNAAQDAHERFGLDRQVSDYIELYSEALAQHASKRSLA